MTRNEETLAAPEALRRPIQSGQGSREEFEIIVVFTHARSTLRALKAAGRLADGLGATIRLLVPHIVPYPVPLEDGLVGTPCLQRRLLTVVGGSRIDTRVDIRLCRNRWQMLRRVLAPKSLVVLGGSDRPWTTESRLTRKLQAAGHHVVFSSDEG
jgi:hypothetical protein